MATTDGAAAGSSGAAAGAAPLAETAVAMLAGLGGGGLAGLRAAFEREGLAPIFDSWVSTGPNLPVSAADLARVLGGGSLAAVASSRGLDVGRLATGLAALLPEVVDRLTPRGVLPDAAGPVP